MLLVALLLQTAPFDVKADYVELAKQHCRLEWPNDFQMQAHCLKEQAGGMIAFKRIAETSGPPLHKAFEKCTEDWTKNGLPDWQMIAYCANEQATAYQALNAPSPR
jgi:hypothetical protein